MFSFRTELHLKCDDPDCGYARGVVNVDEATYDNLDVGKGKVTFKKLKKAAIRDGWTFVEDEFSDSHWQFCSSCSKRHELEDKKKKDRKNEKARKPKART